MEVIRRVNAIHTSKLTDLLDLQKGMLINSDDEEEAVSAKQSLHKQRAAERAKNIKQEQLLLSQKNYQHMQIYQQLQQSEFDMNGKRKVQESDIVYIGDEEEIVNNETLNKKLRGKSADDLNP